MGLFLLLRFCPSNGPDLGVPCLALVMVWVGLGRPQVRRRLNSSMRHMQIVLAVRVVDLPRSDKPLTHAE